MAYLSTRLIVGIAALSVGLAPVAADASGPSTNPTLSTSWGVALGIYDAGHPIAQSSPVEVTGPNGVTAVVVGDRAGNLYELGLSNGNPVAGSSPVIYHSSIPIDSTPSSWRLTGTSSTIFVGLGNRAVACRASDGTLGGYLALSAGGQKKWLQRANNPAAVTSCPHPGVMAGLTLGRLDGSLDVLGSSLSQSEMAFHASSGTSVKGWNPWFQADSSESTAALATLGVGKTAKTYVIEGGDSTAGSGYGRSYQDGGHIRVISAAGNKGVEGSGGQVCSFDTARNGGQIVQSSPAVGPFLAGGQEGIASGVGYYGRPGPQGPYNGAANVVYVLNMKCQVQWSQRTDFETSSPIVADVTGTGHMAVVIGTQNVSKGGSVSGGSVYAFDAATGHVLWHVATGAVLGSPVAADLTGTGHADIVVATTDTARGGLQIIDGISGQVVTRATGFSAQNAPLISADANGRIGITAAGYNTGSWGSACKTANGRCFAGVIYHYQVLGSSSLWLSNKATSWLQFHHDQALTGNTQT